MSGGRTLGEIRIRDPFIIEAASGEYVLYGTTDKNVWGGPAVGFDCYRSSDLMTWEGPYAAFRPDAEFWSSSQFWAPEVVERLGRYIMIATFLRRETGVRGVATLTADSPLGPFRPLSDGPLTPANEPSLDGTIFTDERGDDWLVYSRGPERTPSGFPATADGEMLALRLTSDLAAAIGEPVLLFRASSAAWSRPVQLPPGVDALSAFGLAASPLLTDGPSLARLASGELLMLWSSFGDEGYAIGVARSSSGSVLGPWRQDPEPVWARNGGHGMLLRTRLGDDYLCFHAPNDTPKERARLVPVRIGPTTISIREAS